MCDLNLCNGRSARACNLLRDAGWKPGGAVSGTLLAAGMPWRYGWSAVGWRESNDGGVQYGLELRRWFPRWAVTIAERTYSSDGLKKTSYRFGQPFSAKQRQAVLRWMRRRKGETAAFTTRLLLGGAYFVDDYIRGVLDKLKEARG